eukprot:12241630-Ditylum_brightwellii.AAC.1
MPLQLEAKQKLSTDETRQTTLTASTNNQQKASVTHKKTISDGFKTVSTSNSAKIQEKQAK